MNYRTYRKTFRRIANRRADRIHHITHTYKVIGEPNGPGRLEPRGAFWLKVANDAYYKQEELLVKRCKAEPPTKVIFRVLFGEVIALFPEIPGTYAGDTCESCDRNGHSAADPFFIMRASRSATPDEYRALKHQLESAPYDYTLTVRQRHTKYMIAARQQAMIDLVEGNK